MGDKPRFSPNHTYVLDDTVIKDTDELRLTGILRELKNLEESTDSDPDEDQPAEGD